MHLSHQLQTLLVIETLPVRKKPFLPQVIIVQVEFGDR